MISKMLKADSKSSVPIGNAVVNSQRIHALSHLLTDLHGQSDKQTEATDNVLFIYLCE